MTAPDPRDPAYLEDMLEAIERIRRYVGRKRRAGFLGDSLLQDAVIRNVEIVGEAASRVSPKFAAQQAELPWRAIVGMRHRLVHVYLKVNLDTVWEVVERDLPVLVPRLRALLGAAPAPPVKHSVNKRRAFQSRASRARVPAKRRR